MAANVPQWTVVPQPGYQINSTSLSADGGVCLLGTSQEYGSGEFAVFCYDGAGNLLWSDALATDAYQGVFWVALSANGAYAAAGGTISEAADSAGFLRAYRVADGTRLFELRLPGRVNEVALSDRGDVLAAVMGDRLLVCTLQDGIYRLLADETLSGQSAGSCAISADGSRIAVGTTRAWGSTQGPAGTCAAFAVSAQGVACIASIDVDVGILRVAMVADGGCWVAARHDGQAMAFGSTGSVMPSVPLWTYAPPDLTLGPAYGIAAARNVAGEVDVVCGANLADATHGCVYAVRSTPGPAPGAPPVPVPLWQKPLHHDPNPGINMDRGARLATATDGEPEAGGAETRGNFYLFSVADGELLWRYPTPLMNWPMAISAQGNAAFGGSDDGSAYYWALS